MPRRSPFVLSAIALLAVCSTLAQTPSQPLAARGPQEPMKPLYVLEDSYLNWRLQPADQAYAAIDGKHLKEYVNDQTAISRRYRDSGHQFWGRIIGTEADAENAQWLMEKFRKIGLSDVHEQSFDLPPQWMPQSWSVSVVGGGKTLELNSAQPSYLTPATPPEGLDAEAVDVGFASDGDLAGRDIRGKAVFFYSMDFMSRHSTINGGAIKKLTDRGASAIFVTLLIPGNLRFQFYPVGSSSPTFALGLQDGLAAREMIGQARGGAAPHVKLRLDVKTVPGLKTGTVWGTLPGATDENITIVAHRDGWFEGSNDNGTGVATMLGLAEYFAKTPKEQRRRTIRFLGTSGHHDNAAMSGRWLADHKEEFAKTALLINSEHTAATQLVSYNGVVRKSNEATPLMWYVGGSPKLEQIVIKAFDAFGVATYDTPERGAAGEMGRYSLYAPSMQVIDTGLYWHSDHETSEIIPPTELAASTRAYAKIITEVNKLGLNELQRPAPGTR
ncbi:MAG TPA: M28 family peptidase [Bryobacteraceae bacterium]|nr:M28 family peptidase [Bryobacteraceae bacterium]